MPLLRVVAVLSVSTHTHQDSMGRTRNNFTTNVATATRNRRLSEDANAGTDEEVLAENPMDRNGSGARNRSRLCAWARHRAIPDREPGRKPGASHDRCCNR